MLSSAAERERYLLHENSRENSGYVAYLMRFIEEIVITHVKRGGIILDFGSGPVPVLSELLHEAGFSVTSYDPYFEPDRGYRDAEYDAIILLEVIEHIADPLTVICHLKKILSPQGCIIIQTQLVTPEIMEMFSTWWYKEDRTHISFFSERSLQILAESAGLRAAVFNENVLLLSRKG